MPCVIFDNFCYVNSTAMCLTMYKPPVECRKNTGSAIHGNLAKAPGLTAVAYHRRRICHTAVSSPR